MTAGITSAAYDGTGPFPAASALVRTRAQPTGQVNSLCHLLGSRPFTTRRRDRATNLWPLAVLPLGESWHNMHHSDPACARPGLDRRQIDLSAELIRGFERLGLVSGVRWPTPARLEQRRRPRAITVAHVLAGGRVPTPIDARAASLLAPMSRRSPNAG